MGNRRSLIGDVISNKMEKTVVVAVRTRRQHPQYRKYFDRTKRYKAHDQDNSCKVGDRVLLIETRPLSKEKRWRVAEVLRKA